MPPCENSAKPFLPALFNLTSSSCRAAFAGSVSHVWEIMMTFPSLCFLMRLVPCCVISSWPAKQCNIDKKVTILHMRPVHFFVTQQQQDALDIFLLPLLIITVCFHLWLLSTLSASIWPPSSDRAILQSCFATKVFSLFCKISFWQDNSDLSFLAPMLVALILEQGKVGQSWNHLVDRGQWLIPPESLRRGGAGKAARKKWWKAEREKRKT